MFGGQSFYLVFLLLRPLAISSTNSCKDENNNSLDWFVIYKLPKIKGDQNPLIAAGVAYAYSSSGIDKGWVLSDKSINDSSSMPGVTLKPLYDKSLHISAQDALYILYNDQPPVGNVSFDGGHTKGVVYTEKTGGFWLVHSVPHYPPLPKEGQYSYPKTGMKNGQSYLCVSIPPDQMDVVGIQLMYNDPHIFVNATPVDLMTEFPKLSKAALGIEIHSPPWYNSLPLVSTAGTTFQTFAKAPQFKKDLYSDWVVTALEVDLLVETWPNGPGRLNSSCNLPHRVENVDSVKMPFAGEDFSSHKDHSKWAISETKDEPWVCIGDINRATTQAIRGGGTVCFKDPMLWQTFNNSVSSVESCPEH